MSGWYGILVVLIALGCFYLGYRFGNRIKRKGQQTAQDLADKVGRL